LRLSQEQITQIQKVIASFWKQIPFEIYLYGSRVHDHLKGGDLDLLVLTNEEGVTLYRDIHLDVLVELKKKPEIGDRKIDFKVLTKKILDSDPFWKKVSQEMVRIG